MPASRSRSSHDSPSTGDSPTLAEQQCDGSTESQILGRSDQRLGVSGGEGATRLDPLRPGRFDQIERVGGNEPELHSLGECLPADLPAVEHGVRRVLVEQLGLPLCQEFGADVDYGVGSDVVGQVAGELAVAVER